MTEKKLSKRQKTILYLLDLHGEMTTRNIFELLYPDAEIYIKGKVNCQSSKYRSVTRSLRSLRKRHLVEKVVGQTLWKKA